MWTSLEKASATVTSRMRLSAGQSCSTGGVKSVKSWSRRPTCIISCRNAPRSITREVLGKVWPNLASTGRTLAHVGFPQREITTCRVRHTQPCATPSSDALPLANRNKSGQDPTKSRQIWPEPGRNTSRHIRSTSGQCWPKLQPTLAEVRPTPVNIEPPLVTLRPRVVGRTRHGRRASLVTSPRVWSVNSPKCLVISSQNFNQYPAAQVLTCKQLGPTCRTPKVAQIWPKLDEVAPELANIAKI